MDRLNNLEWDRKRKLVLERDKFKCRRSHLGECKGELDVHHVEPWEVGHDDSTFNLITVCDRHHKRLENDYKRMGYLTTYMKKMIMENKLGGLVG